MSPFRTMIEALDCRVKQHGPTAAFIFRDKLYGRRVMTWTDLHTLAGRFAAVLRDGGLQSCSEVSDDDILYSKNGAAEENACRSKKPFRVGRGDLVVNALPNSPERVVCEAGVMLSGAATVNGQCLMADGSDLLRTLRVSRATAILLDPDVSDSPWKVLRHHITLDHDDTVTSSKSLPDLRKVYMVRRVANQGPMDFLDTLRLRQSWFKADDVTSDDTVTVLPTSGSEGFSKLVIHTHGYFANICNGNDVWSEMFSDKEPIREFNMAPLGWGGGCIYLLLISGNTRVLVDSRDGILPNINEVIWQSIQEERCTRAYLSPKFLPDLTRQAETNPAAHKMKTILLGGMPINRFMVQASLSIADEVLLDYASTDFGLVSGLHVTDWKSYVDHDTGPPAFGVRVKIVSQDDENVELPVNQLGSILIQQQNMPQGYLNDPTATAELFTEDGFVRTGDVGRLDERGHLLVEGRGSDAIMRGPFIHYPIWLEHRIRACPLVCDALVVGVPDPFLYEEICACVQLKPQIGLGKDEAKALKEVQQWMEQEITVSEDNPLSPRPRFYLSFPQLPETSTDKPRRKEARKMAAQRLGLA